MDAMFDRHRRAPKPVREPMMWPLPIFWTVLDVYKYICDIGYEKYAKCFTENAIAGRDLINIDAFDLQRLGVSRMDDAIRLSAHIRKTATTKLTSRDNSDHPPNILYSSRFNPEMLPAGEARLPSTSSLRNLRLPYRDRGDRLYRYQLPVQPYHGHCMVMGRTDVWKLYNSDF